MYCVAISSTIFIFSRTMNENTVENGEEIAKKLIKAIEKDKHIASSNSLNWQAVRDNLPAICQTIIKAIAENNLSLLATCEDNQGSEHGYTRSGQDFNPEEIVREFFLLKQIVLAQLKPQLLLHSPEKIVEEIALIDLVINRVMENSFQSYAKARQDRLENLHQQIFFTNQELNRLVEDRQDSISYLTHEIKNPLTAIIGYSDLFLRQQRKNDRQDSALSDIKHIQQVLQQGRKVLRLIDDTLAISSYCQNNFKLRVQKINICNLLENITLSLKPSIEAKKLTLITSCIPEGLEIKSDSLRLQQIITNLLTNAIRYTPSGKIELTCHKIEQEFLEIKVADTGIGISKSDRERIFEPYFRSQKSRENVPEGIGLGLAIVSQLVNMLKGKIELISEVNKGSTFIAIVPVDLESHHVFESNPENRT